MASPEATDGDLLASLGDAQGAGDFLTATDQGKRHIAAMVNWTLLIRNGHLAGLHGYGQDRGRSLCADAIEARAGSDRGGG